jgi:hypothetical protein
MATKVIRIAVAVPLLAILLIAFLFALLLEVVAERRSAGAAGG